MNLKEILEKHKKWLNYDKDGERANLREADLSYADLREADLSGADLSEADLRGADLRDADLSDANLSGADLRDADLSNANLSGADLRDADLSNANLSGADLSNAVNVLSQIDYIKEHFEFTDEGVIAYKTFNNRYTPPEKWVIQQGSIITENVNFDRTNPCACGINVAPLEWVERNRYGVENIWKCLIRWEWLCGVCVPYNTDGKIRCEKVELIEVVE